MGYKCKFFVPYKIHTWVEQSKNILKTKGEASSQEELIARVYWENFVFLYMMLKCILYFNVLIYVDACRQHL
jgi:hypothetical protein